jgi:hypothetical protein
MAEPFVIARTAGGGDVLFLPSLANRHGLVTGATGTGKTVTLQVLAEHFSRIGVPVFMADVKGDLSGIAVAGATSPKLIERLKTTGFEAPAWSASPVAFWDVFGKRGVPVRATISDLGPLLLSRLFNLNPTQQGVLTLIFKVADDNGLLLLDLKDLRAMLQFAGDNAQTFTTKTATSPRRRSAPSSDRCSRSNSRAARRFSASRCSTSTICCRPTPGARHGQRPRGGELIGRRSSTRSSCSGCCRSCSSGCPRWAIPTSRRWCSSSMRRICCLPMRRSRSSRRSSRWSG